MTHTTNGKRQALFVASAALAVGAISKKLHNVQKTARSGENGVETIVESLGLSYQSREDLDWSKPLLAINRRHGIVSVRLRSKTDQPNDENDYTIDERLYPDGHHLNNLFPIDGIGYSFYDPPVIDEWQLFNSVHIENGWVCLYDERPIKGGKLVPVFRLSRPTTPEAVVGKSVRYWPKATAVMALLGAAYVAWRAFW